MTRRRIPARGRWATPSARLKAHLIPIGEWDEARQRLDAEIEAGVDADNKCAQALGVHGGGPYHDPATMFEDVYKDMPWNLREQQAELARVRASAGRSRP